jgi:hypothetical protein
MLDILAKILELSLSLKSAYDGAERFLRARLLAASFSILRGVRRAMIMHQCMMIASFIWAMSFFATGMILCFPWSLGGAFLIHPALFFSGGSLAATSLLLYLGWREETWLQATGLKDVLRTLEEPSSSPVSRRELSALVDELLEERLAKLAKTVT